MVDYPVGTRFDWPKTGHWVVIIRVVEEGLIRIAQGVGTTQWPDRAAALPSNWVGIPDAKITFPKQYFIEKFNKFAKL